MKKKIRDTFGGAVEDTFPNCPKCGKELERYEKRNTVTSIQTDYKCRTQGCFYLESHSDGNQWMRKKPCKWNGGVHRLHLTRVDGNYADFVCIAGDYSCSSALPGKETLIDEDQYCHPI